MDIETYNVVIQPRSTEAVYYGV